MKTKIGLLLVALVFALSNLNAQDVTTVEATDSDISENLDLEAVASLFGEAENLEDFEKKLNDPKTQISNLDLNEDGEVDYLRVVETSKDGTHLVTIQAVIEKDKYQDVATIDVEKDSGGETQVQVVGDVYMYGPNYIIEPVYVHPPVVIIWFWGPYYNPWRSPYYYGYYPPYYRPWRPYPPHRYQTNVNVHINVNNSYKHTTVRKSNTSVELQNKSRRNDYGSANPDKSFSNRNDGVKNKDGLNTKSGTTNKANETKPKATKESTGKQTQDDWKPASDSKVKDNKVSVPSTKPATQPTTKPAAKPASKPTTKPTTKPASKPTAKPASKPKRK
ncbi:MAG: hypothetical protein GQ525_05510 [Draconibacterium sp.]|nr:hypothetical protein [Draconibacterium sp.]